MMPIYTSAQATKLKGKADEAKILSEMALFRRCILLLKGSTVKTRPVREMENSRFLLLYKLLCENG